jgi:hypothetical protein
MIELLDFLKIGDTLGEVLTAFAPLVLVFLIFQIFFLKLPKEFLIRILKGLAMTFLGLVLFLQGVKAGFIPAGTKMGEIIGAFSYRWVLMPIGFVLGFAATVAEPAVWILGFEVEKASSGSIRGRIILFTLAIGVACITALGMARILYGIPIKYIIIPGYLIVLIMLLFTDTTFVSIAFDAGGVGTGPMTGAFVMALAVGTATVMENRSPILDGFGLIALVALAPVMSLMIFGLLYTVGKRK